MSTAAVPLVEVGAAGPPGAQPAKLQNLAIGYLRSFVTVLVLALHAVFAYHPFARSERAPLTALPRVLAWAGPQATGAHAEPAGAAPRAHVDDLLASMGIHVTSGAAAGYVPDHTCRLCHSELFRAYQEVGMARSFFRPASEKVIEDFEHSAFFHPASQRYYEMRMRENQLTFRRYQLDESEQRVNVFEQDVDWILGSGRTSRTYLYRTPGGELYQLPLAWYSQTGRWAMAPGYDNADHPGIQRAARRECLFCHNAYPEVPAGSDDHDMPHVFPTHLPEGIGCQRCHGPGAEHVRAAFQDPGDSGALRAAIVQPGRLPAQLRNDVCNQCHLQPSIVLFGPRRFGRRDYSYRPGEPLPEYALKVDVDEAGRERFDRFEINHHPYRLAQSACFRKSEGVLSCLTCHDPHKAVESSHRVVHYREACLGCHTLDDCHLEDTPVKTGWPTSDAGDCVSCHMPRRRTEDVVHVVMTDHFIRRRPPQKDELLVARDERETPTLEEAEILDAARVPATVELDIYRAVAVGRARPMIGAVDYLEGHLDPAKTPDHTPYLDLARGQISLRRFAQALTTLDDLLAREPELSPALSLRGIALAKLGRGEEAVALLREVAALTTATPEVHFNLGRLLLGYGHPEGAVEPLEMAVRKRPNFAAALFHLAEAHRRLGQRDEAIAHYRRALEIDPTLTRAYLALGEMLLEQGNGAAAKRLWRHGVRVVEDAAALRQALAQSGLESEERER